MVLGVVCGAGPVRAQPGADASQMDVWVRGASSSAAALQLQGHLRDGEREFLVCSHCHLPSAAGRTDGSIPQLAGQHRSVLIKQLVDIREGHRRNPLMDPFARTILSPQQLADLTAYLEALPIPRDNGRGPGTDLVEGGALYERDCRSCHGAEGEGDASQFVPVLAGQHYAYLLRQLREITVGVRRNVHPAMQTTLPEYSLEQLAALADYVSRLEWPERQQN